MSESILISVKHKIGISDDDTGFDDQIIDYINATFSIVWQLGDIGKKNFCITGSDETWADYLGDDETKFSMVKSYVALKVKTMFDPGQSNVQSANEKVLAEFESRLNYMSDPTVTEIEASNYKPLWDIGEVDYE
jgi:hypothetical protein